MLLLIFKEQDGRQINLYLHIILVLYDENDMYYESVQRDEPMSCTT